MLMPHSIDEFFYILILLNICSVGKDYRSTLGVSDEVYYRNTSRALNLIFTCLLYKKINILGQGVFDSYTMKCYPK